MRAPLLVSPWDDPYLKHSLVCDLPMLKDDLLFLVWKWKFMFLIVWKRLVCSFSKSMVYFTLVPICFYVLLDLVLSILSQDLWLMFWIFLFVTFRNCNVYVCTGYIKNYQVHDPHRVGRITVDLQGRVNDCKALTYRQDLKAKEIDQYTERTLPTRQVSFFPLDYAYLTVPLI